MSLLIAGGRKDPNLTALAYAAAELSIPVIDARHDSQIVPAFSWNLSTGQAWLDETSLEVAGAFCRHDVFEAMANPSPEAQARALGWTQAVQGWLLASPGIRLFNRNASQIAGCKPAMLMEARKAGFNIPATFITNDLTALTNLPQGSRVAKPVAGGGYCVTLEQARDMIPTGARAAPIPAIVQERLSSPEIRIYSIGDRAFTFEMRTASLDYRVKQDVQIIPRECPARETGLLRALLASVSMDFGAADLKADSQTGEFVFLELNTSPMFARFNAEADGELCRAMVSYLTAR